MKYRSWMMRIPAKVSARTGAALATSGCVFEDHSENALPLLLEVPSGSVSLVAQRPVDWVVTSSDSYVSAHPEPCVFTRPSGSAVRIGSRSCRDSFWLEKTSSTRTAATSAPRARTPLPATAPGLPPAASPPGVAEPPPRSGASPDRVVRSPSDNPRIPSRASFGLISRWKTPRRCSNHAMLEEDVRWRGSLGPGSV